MSRSTLARRFWATLLALALPLLALAIKVALDKFIGHAVPFLLFFGTIILVAWRGGQNYGIFASLWSGFLATVAFMPGAGLDAPHWVQLTVFTAEGIFISILTACCRSAQDGLTVRARRQSALAQISGLALSQSHQMVQMSERTTEICAQTLGLERVVVWQNGSEVSATDDAFFLTLLERHLPVTIQSFTPSNPEISEKWRGNAAAALAVPIGDPEHPFGVLLALDNEPNCWCADEADFLTAVAGILAVAAQRTQAEELRRKDEMRYRAFVKQSSEAIWCCEFTPPIIIEQLGDDIVDQTFERGVLVECNQAFAQISGFASAQDLIGTRLCDVRTRDTERNLDYLRQLQRSNFKLDDVYTSETSRDGRFREFSNNLVGIVEGGQLLRIWITMRDITTERAAMAQLSASEQRFRALFDAAPVAIAISRGENLLYVNEAAVKLLGCDSAVDMIGHPVQEFVAPPDRETMQKRIERRTQGFEEPLVYEAVSLRRDGTTRPFRIEVSPLELPDGPATLAFAFDLTAEKATEAQRQLLWNKERRSAHRAVRLQEITASLAATATLTVDDVARLIITQGVDALEATSGALSEVKAVDGEQRMLIVASVGYSEAILQEYGNLPMDIGLPVVQAYLNNQPFWSANKEETLEAHPVFATVIPRTGSQAICALPLEVEGRVLGILSLSFDSAQDFDAETRAFMLTLAGQCAQALDRVRLFNEARDAARAQQESLALLNTLLASAPIGIAFFDLEGRHVLVNEALSKMDGVSMEGHLGKTSTEMVPRVNGEVEALIAHVVTQGEPVSEWEYIRPAGEAHPNGIHILISFYPVHDAEGQISGVGGMFLDITLRARDERERIQLMGELEIERARFEAILQQMPSAVIIAEAPSGRIILGNPQVESVLRRQYDPEETFADYQQYRGFHLDGSELQVNEWPLVRAIEEGVTTKGEQFIIGRGDGSMGIIRMNAAPVRDRDGQITAGIAIFDDVTQSARADNAQRFLAEAGSALLSTLDEGQTYERLARLCVPSIADWCVVAVPDENGGTAQVSVAHADPDKVGVAHRNKQRLVETAELPWNPALRGRKSVVYNEDLIESFQALGAGRDYGEFLTEIGALSVIVSPLGARGRTLGVMIWIVTDSERTYDDADRELADELARRAGLTADGARLYAQAQASRDEAQNANRAKDEFLAVVSHELRTPLTPILGWLEMLRNPSVDDSLRSHAYNVIERNARAQGQLVNDILDVSRITTGKLRMDFKQARLSDLVKDAVESMRTNALVKNIDLVMEIEEVGDANLDASRIQQVVWNLLQNAIKFTPENGRVRVSLGKTGDTARLEVADSGAGIDPEFLPYVFDRFRQADSSATRKAGGLGLGLAIVSHIVGRHGGQASAHSEGEGRGATFIMELPVLGEQTNELESAPSYPTVLSAENEIGALDGLRILVTDDEPDTREMMKVMLRSYGADVQTASSAHEAFDLLKNDSTDVLISDIGMPFIDGYEMRRELTARGFDRPSIALTAYTAPRDAQRALEAGFNAHLPKPVDAVSLMKLIEKLARPES